MNSRRIVLLTIAAVGVLLLVTAAVVVVLIGRDSDSCHPAVPPVDAQATQSAWCAAATLDDWRARSVMGVGQQLDVQEAPRMRQPLEALGALYPAVIGFDFDELLNAQDFFDNDPVPYLSDLAHAGRILTATWHPANPVSGGRFDDRSWTSTEELLDPQSAASKAFWPRYERVLVEAKRFQDADVSVIFKPLHEAAGSYFWWADPDPVTYKRLFAELQARAFAAGVHNLLWGYAANPQRYDTDQDPVALVPDAVDLVGIDVYDDPASTTLTLASYQALAAVAARMALTEVGPSNSATGEWDPAIITETLNANDLYANYAMLWRDDPAPGNRYQISSLAGGLDWLASCPEGLCPLD